MIKDFCKKYKIKKNEKLSIYFFLNILLSNSEKLTHPNVHAYLYRYNRWQNKALTVIKRS